MTRKVLLVIGLCLVIGSAVFLWHDATQPDTFYRTEGRSMEPTIHPGDNVGIQYRPLFFTHYQVGDIVVYNATIFIGHSNLGIWEPELIDHRVVAVTYQNGSYWYQTRGDNPATNPVQDSFDWAAYSNSAQPPWWGSGWIHESQVLGEIVVIYYENGTTAWV